MSTGQLPAETAGPKTWVIEDPGDAGAISTMFSGVCALTSGASGETRTLGAPQAMGQWIRFIFDTDGGGDIEITVSASYAVTSKTTLTFANAGQCYSLWAGTIAGALVWRTDCQEITAGDYAAEG